MHCPRCGRSLLALARRPSSWSASDKGTWVGLHFGDTQGTSSCRLQHDEAMGLAPPPVATLPSLAMPVARRAA